MRLPVALLPLAGLLFSFEPALAQYQQLETSTRLERPSAPAVARESVLEEEDAVIEEAVPDREPEVTPAEAGDSDEDDCPAAVEAYMEGRSIVFRAGSTQPTSESLAMLPGLAEILLGCSERSLHVEGHTDAVGGAALNLTLSVRRAEAVVDALIALGIAPERLYAVGYGASLPIASNQTEEGRARNRRIVFSFEDPAQPQGES